MKKILALLAVILLVPLLRAQLARDFPGAAGKTTGVSFAPLYVFTNGPGKIYIYPFMRLHPDFQNGQMVPVNAPFVLTAIRAQGYEFAGWSPVDVFTTSELFTNADGSVSVITQVLPEAGPPIRHGPVLDARVTSWTNVVQTPLVTISTGRGWQANFAPIQNFR